MTGGDSSGFDPTREMASIYQELRRMARRFFESQPSAHTLQPTALVHEVFVRLASSGTQVRDRAHLANLCARAMRQVLVDHARAKNARRRREAASGDAVFGDGHAGTGGGQPTPEDVVALHEALDQYQALDERRSRLVELRIFGGFSLEQSAELVGVSRSTASEDWRVARAWLSQAMAAG